MTNMMDFYYEKRKFVFKRIYESSNIEKGVIVILMACFTGIMAQVVIPLYWSPVPITGQTFAVLVSGLILGRKLGPLSQLLYIIIGVLGVPWFADMSSGLNIFLGSTGGYMIGFVFASIFIGYISEKYSKSRNIKKMLIVMLIANYICITLPGLFVLAIWYYLTVGNLPDIGTLLIIGFIPFIAGDMVKIIGASFFSKILLPK
ncbi:MAG: biotin transporter BioY [Methanobrevibacter sp.]|jgi:biotin transport system substrate-specific component|nr:biotin transporter BioY [Candidatus Methanovirga basalitermitum]